MSDDDIVYVYFSQRERLLNTVPYTSVYDVAFTIYGNLVSFYGEKQDRAVCTRFPTLKKPLLSA